MSLLLAAVLFGLSIFLIFFSLGRAWQEKRSLRRRVERLYGSLAGNVSDEFLKKKVRARTLESKKDEQSTTGVLIAVVWLGAGALVLHLLKVPAIGAIIFLVIIPLLLIRFGRILFKKRRLERVERELPGALDLMVVCLEAGLGINSALLRVAKEMEGSPLGHELKRASDEVSAGIPLPDALRNFAKRTEASDVNTIVSSIVQAQKMGSGLVQTFRVQSDSLREKTKTKIKEKIYKIPIKIIFPLVFFIFPALFIVILAPAFISIMKTLSHQ